MRKYIWCTDNNSGIDYNTAGALEVVLMNLGMVHEDKQWDMDELAEYAAVYKEVTYDNGHLCKDTGGRIYTDSEFTERFRRVLKRNKLPKINFESTSRRNSNVRREDG